MVHIFYLYTIAVKTGSSQNRMLFFYYKLKIIFILNKRMKNCKMLNFIDDLSEKI